MKHKYVPVYTLCTARTSKKNLIKQADPLGWNVRGIRTRPPPPFPTGNYEIYFFFVKKLSDLLPLEKLGLRLNSLNLFPPGKFLDPPPPLVKAPYPHISYFTHRTQQHDATVKDFLLFLPVIFHLLPS